MGMDLDLDALVPKNRIVKFQDQEITVKPPTTKQVLKLAAIGQKMQDPEALTEQEADKLETDMAAAVALCIPELSGQALSNSQLMALLTLIMEMGMPPDDEELKKRGITVDDSKKAQ